MKVGDRQKTGVAVKMEWLRSQAITPHCIIKDEWSVRQLNKHCSSTPRLLCDSKKEAGETEQEI